MSEQRFLVVRLGSLGDIVHTLPAVHALRKKFPAAEIDWLVEKKWQGLLAGNADLNEVILLDRSSWGEMTACVRGLRSKNYDCALDFQGLYKSSILARLSGAPRRIGFAKEFLREGGASWFYTQHVRPAAGHVIEMNLAIAQSMGAVAGDASFPIVVPDGAERAIRAQLESQGVSKYFVMSPGGGWMSKCWPAEQYGLLHQKLMSLPAFAGWRGVVNFGPGELELAETVRRAAGEKAPVLISTDLPQLMALLRGAAIFVGGDTGPLHLAVALGTPVVGLYGPTDPARNGPYSRKDIVVRNARPDETTYKRGTTPAPSMLSITVEQVVAAMQKRLGVAQ